MLLKKIIFFFLIFLTGFASFSQKKLRLAEQAISLKNNISFKLKIPENYKTFLMFRVLTINPNLQNN